MTLDSRVVAWRLGRLRLVPISLSPTSSLRRLAFPDRPRVVAADIGGFPLWTIGHQAAPDRGRLLRLARGSAATAAFLARSIDRPVLPTLGRPFSRSLHRGDAAPLEDDEDRRLQLHPRRVQRSEEEPRLVDRLAVGVGSVDDAIGTTLEEGLKVMSEKDGERSIPRGIARVRVELAESLAQGVGVRRVACH